MSFRLFCPRVAMRMQGDWRRLRETLTILCVNHLAKTEHWKRDIHENSTRQFPPFITNYSKERLSVENTLMLGKIEGKRRRGKQNEVVGWHH